MTRTTSNATKAQKAVIKAVMQRGVLHLIQPHATGGFDQPEAQMDAHEHIREAIKLCTRGGRRDLAEQLLAIAAELHRPGCALAVAHRQRLAANEVLEPAPQPAPVKPRRKRKPTMSPGQRAKARAVKRGAKLLTA